MELETLKQNWNAIDNRLSKMEDLNRKTVKELLQTRTRTAVDKLTRSDAWGFISIVVVPILVTIGLGKGDVVSDETLWLMFGVYAYLPFVLFRGIILSKYNVFSPTTDLMNLVLKYRKVLTLEKMMLVPISLFYCIGIVITERSWTFRSDKLPQVLCFMTVIAIVIIVAQLNGFKRHLNTLKEIEAGLEELKSVQ